MISLNLIKTTVGHCSNRDRHKILSEPVLKVLVEKPFLDIVFYNIHHPSTSQSGY